MQWPAARLVLAIIALLAHACHHVAQAYQTIDAGQNMTFHLPVNIGPYDSDANYNLNVHGNMNVGRPNIVDPFTEVPGVNVQGRCRRAALCFATEARTYPPTER